MKIRIGDSQRSHHRFVFAIATTHFLFQNKLELNDMVEEIRKKYGRNTEEIRKKYGRNTDDADEL